MVKTHEHKALSIKLIILLVILLITLTGVLIDKSITKKPNLLYTNGAQNLSLEYKNNMKQTQLTIGDKDAPITMIAYIDYEDPYSKKLYSKTYQELKKEYIENNKLKIIIRNYPQLKHHENSLELAQIVHCTYEQDKSPLGFEVVLSERKTNIEDTKNTLSLLGINITKLDNCINSGKYENGILLDLQIAKNNGVTQTPTFIIGDEVIEGPKAFKEFEDIIDKKLNETIE